MSNDRRDAAGYLGWFLFGAVLGAAAALLTAPRAGRETRELLRERSQEAARRAQQWAGEAQIQAGAWLDKSREMFEEQTQRLISAFEAGKEAMREEIRKWSTTARG
ncbi:MAG TPA: YtxH domain-containing protein [Candidatus Binatia bacterium]|nr:YtxH domain-containing protein [Candidatus Binatia bacterium]